MGLQLGICKACSKSMLCLLKLSLHENLAGLTKTEQGVPGQVIICEGTGALLDTKILVWATRIVAGGQDETSICLTPMPVTYDCRHGWC